MARKGQITKSVILSGGMQDDVSEFLQESPSLAYIENGRFRKKDEVEKRLPDTALVTTGLPTEGSPLMLASPKGQALITLDDDGTLYTFDPETDTTWGSRSTSILPYTSEVIFKTAPEPGLATVQAGEAKNASVEQFKMIAFEQELGTDHSLIVEVYRPSGDLWFRERIQSAQEPKVRAATFYGKPYVFFTKSTDQDIHYGTKSGNGLATGTLGFSTISLYNDEHPFTKAMVAEGTIPNGSDDLLPGAKEESRHFWQIAYGTPTDENSSSGAVVWLDDSTTYGRMKIAKLSGTTSLGTAYTLHTNSSTDCEVPLAIAFNPDDDESVIISAQYSPATKIGKLVFRKFDHGTDTTVSSGDYADSVINNEWWVKASCFYDESEAVVEDRWRFAATVCGGDPDVMTAPNISEGIKTIAGRWDDFTGNAEVEDFWHDHTLASELTYDIYDDNPVINEYLDRRTVFALEQWTPRCVPNKTGDDNNNPAYTNEFYSVPALIRPHTTIIVSNIRGGGSYKLLATLGAGQNKCDNPNRDIVNTHLNGAYNVYGDDAPRICTRNLLQPMDMSWKWSNPANGPRLKEFYYGEASGRVTRLDKATTLKSRVYGETTLFASAVPTQYDGVAYGEQSVFDQPEIVSIGQGSYSTDSTLDYQVWAYEKDTTGDVADWYVFQIVVGFADHKGHLHRSAPSTPLWIYGMREEENFVDANLAFTLPLSAYGSQRDYFVEVYVGEGEGARHLVASKSFNPINNSQNYVDFYMHHYANGDWKYPVRWSETVYTEGDVLPSDPWPAFNDFVLTSNRMFAISSEVPGTVYYSKLLEENINPEFSAPLVLSLGRNRNLTAIGKIDDKVIIFTDDNEIFAIYDTGPDNTGANGDFVIDQLQTTVGCSDTDSLVEIPDGLVFYSDRSREFHILSRDLQVHDIGKPIEDTANALTNIKAAIVVPDEHEIRWYVDSASQKEFGESPATATGGIPARPPQPRYQNVLPSTGPVLVYNYHYKKWMVFSGQDAQHVVLYQNYPAYINSDWELYQASTDAWGEEGHSLTIRTPWIRLNQLQSYGRLDQATFLAKYLSDWRDNGNGFEAGDVHVTVRYDYEENFDGLSPKGDPSDTFLFRANNGDLGGKGQTSADLYEGGPVPVEYRFGRCQFTVTPGRQKIQAVQFEITDQATTPINVNEPTDYVLGRGIAISGVDLIYSPKHGTGQKSSPEGTHK